MPSTLRTMEWILEKLPVLIFVIVFIAQVVRGIMRARQDTPTEPARPDALEEQRRAQEIQAEIRRKIMQRRTGQTEPPVVERRAEEQVPEPPPVMRRDPTAIPDPFGGPLKRMFEEIERRAQPMPAPVPAPPPLVESRNAELVRQERLAEELRVSEESRALAKRRAQQLLRDKAAEARTTSALRTAARGRLLDDLQDRESLRRAIVLREVLGTPVGLR